MEIEPKDHPGGPGVLYFHEGRYKSEDGSLDVRATISRDGRLVTISTNRVFTVEESLAEIREKLVEQFGKPDRMRQGGRLVLEYKQRDDSGRPLARLRISVNFVRNPAEICRLPPHLRDGRTVARMNALLTDIARRDENTKTTIAEIREWNVNAVRDQNAEQERKMREIVARQQAFAANGC